MVRICVESIRDLEEGKRSGSCLETPVLVLLVSMSGLARLPHILLHHSHSGTGYQPAGHFISAACMEPA